MIYLNTDEKDFGGVNVSKSIKDIYNGLVEILDKSETLLTLPIDYIKQNMSNEDFQNYLKLRSKTIDVLNLLEVFVFDTHEEQVRCFMCNETVAQIVTRKRNGCEVDTINGEVEHWVNNNGSISHIFICEKCLRKQRDQ